MRRHFAKLKNIWVLATAIAVSAHALPVSLMYLFQPQPPTFALGTTYIELSPISMVLKDVGRAQEEEVIKNNTPKPTKKIRVNAAPKQNKKITKKPPPKRKISIKKPPVKPLRTKISVPSALIPQVEKAMVPAQSLTPTNHNRKYLPTTSVTDNQFSESRTPRPASKQAIGANPPPRSTVIGVRSGEKTTNKKAIWRAEVIAHLTRHKKYPALSQRKKQEGVPIVLITLNLGGTVVDAKLHTPSRHRLLNIEAVNLARRASPLPAPPVEINGGQPVTVTVPIQFELIY